MRVCGCVQLLIAWLCLSVFWLLLSMCVSVAAVDLSICVCLFFCLYLVWFVYALLLSCRFVFPAFVHVSIVRLV